MEGVRAVATVVAGILIAQDLYAQEQKPWNVDRLCGRIEHVQRAPVGKVPNASSEKRTSLRDVSVVLYDRVADTPGCTGGSVADTTKTSRGGHFEFKNKKPGTYCLSMNWSGKEYKVVVVYHPQKTSQTLCSEQGIGIDDEGNADWWMTITVD
jgi:hypothetical protein